MSDHDKNKGFLEPNPEAGFLETRFADAERAAQGSPARTLTDEMIDAREREVDAPWAFRGEREAYVAGAKWARDFVPSAPARLSLEKRGFNVGEMAEFVHHLTPDVEFVALGDGDQERDYHEYGSITRPQMIELLKLVEIPTCTICKENHGKPKIPLTDEQCDATFTAWGWSAAGDIGVDPVEQRAADRDLIREMVGEALDAIAGRAKS